MGVRENKLQKPQISQINEINMHDDVFSILVKFEICFLGLPFPLELFHITYHIYSP